MLIKELKLKQQVYGTYFVGKTIKEEFVEPKTGKKLMVVELSDESGRIECDMWEDECVERTKKNIGKKIKINKFYVKEFNDELRLTSGNFGWISKN